MTVFTLEGVNHHAAKFGFFMEENVEGVFSIGACKIITHPDYDYVLVNVYGERKRYKSLYFAVKRIAKEFNPERIDVHKLYALNIDESEREAAKQRIEIRTKEIDAELKAQIAEDASATPEETVNVPASDVATAAENNETSAPESVIGRHLVATTGIVAGGKHFRQGENFAVISEPTRPGGVYCLAVCDAQGKTLPINVPDNVCDVDEEYMQLALKLQILVDKYTS